jgi:hypothetical protein
MKVKKFERGNIVLKRIHSIRVILLEVCLDTPNLGRSLLNPIDRMKNTLKINIVKILRFPWKKPFLID